jgi:hypothetical protein
LNRRCNVKTGNVFVTETLPKYTIFCLFTACSGEKIEEVITNGSGVYTILSVFAFLVHSLVTELCPKRIFPCPFPSLSTCFVLIGNVVNQLVCSILLEFAFGYFFPKKIPAYL